MPKTLEALRKLQSIERQLAELRRSLRTRSAAVEAQQNRVDELTRQYEALHEDYLARQKETASAELELRTREEEVAKLRQTLNLAKTNKEYAAVLTRINTIKADNSKREDRTLKLMQASDEIRERAQQAKRQIRQGGEYLEEVGRTSAGEVARLESMVGELQQQRDRAAGDVPAEALTVFERIASRRRDGDAMAEVEVVGGKSPYEYVCGGCNMTIRAEHPNALRTRDEIRICDNCGRILYLDESADPQ